MTGVIIAAGSRDKKMWQNLPAILRQNLPAIFAEELPRRGVTEEPGLVICDPEGARKLKPERVVIICKDAQGLTDGVHDGVDAVAVVDSANSKAVKGVSAMGLPAITCGLSTRDTLTLTSYEEDSAVLGVQRSISCFDGTVAEPQEIPLRLSRPIDSFTLMASSSVFVLTGNTNRLREAVF